MSQDAWNQPGFKRQNSLEAPQVPTSRSRQEGMEEVGPIALANGSGVQFARTTMRTAMPWNYFTHDQARSRAYHWGEDGLAGICDYKQLLCFSVAVWNEKDPILKERCVRVDETARANSRRRRQRILFLSLTTPHAFLHEVPVQIPTSSFHTPTSRSESKPTRRRNRRRHGGYELLDTGIFSEDRYFDVFVESTPSSRRKTS